MDSKSFLKSHGLPIALVAAVVVGSVVGLLMKGRALVLKPFGEVLLNALYVTVVPLVFFSISSAVAGMTSTRRLFRVLGWMIVVFVATGVLASSLMVVAVRCYPPAAGMKLNLGATAATQPLSTAQQIVGTLTVPNFADLLKKENMLALILFSVLVGLAASTAGEKGRAFVAFLQSGSEVLMKVITYVMYYAPVGLAAYFAWLVGVHGPTVLDTYKRAMVLYYPLCIAYFFIAFTGYAWLAGRGRGVRRFWGNIGPASMMALATGSSFATIPLNLQAAERVGVPRDIAEVVIPIGATIHMDGSCLAAVLKIALLFGVLGMDFTAPGTMVTAVGVAILSGVVMSGIPGGGFTGEILIIALYGFPPDALPIITLIGVLVDPPATMVNSIGDNVASMMVARILGGRKWMEAA
jgi:Na+/H+-dicarboxylate symporter